MTSSRLPEPEPFHPLMQRLSNPVSRRAVMLGASGLLAAGISRAGAAGAQEGLATPEIQVSGEDDAVALLQRSAEVLAELETFAFELETTRGSSTIFQGFELNGVEGIVRRPTDLQAEVRIGTPIGSLTVGAISLDGVFYIQDPLSAGAWMEVGQMGEAQSLINPDILILAAVRLVQDATITGTEKIDGADTTIVEGTVDFSGLLEQAEQAGEGDISQFLTGEPVDVLFWIDEEDRIVEVEMLGPIFASESDDVVRVVSLFDFNEPVEIEKPENFATPET